MSAQLIVLGTRRPDSDPAYQAYVGAVGPLLFGAGGTPAGQYAQQEHLSGDEGPGLVLVMDFPDADAIRSVFESDAYAAALPDRDAAFEEISVFVGAGV